MLFCDIGKYIVYSDGKIWSKLNKKFLKPSLNIWGYERVQIYQEKMHKCSVHQLVAICFLDNWSNKLQVNHKNEIKTDNNLNNLEMLTAKENKRYSNAKKVIRSDGKIYQALRDVKLDGFDICNVGKCCNKKRKTSSGYKWSFLNKNKKGELNES